MLPSTYGFVLNIPGATSILSASAFGPSNSGTVYTVTTPITGSTVTYGTPGVAGTLFAVLGQPGVIMECYTITLTVAAPTDLTTIQSWGEQSAPTSCGSPGAPTGTLNFPSNPPLACNTSISNVIATPCNPATQTYQLSFDIDYTNFCAIGNMQPTVAGINVGFPFVNTTSNPISGTFSIGPITLPADASNDDIAVVVSCANCGSTQTNTAPAACNPTCDADPGTVSVNTNFVCALGQGGIEALEVMTNNDFEDDPSDPCNLAGTPGVQYLVYSDTPNGGDPCTDPNFTGAALGSGPVADPGMLSQNVALSYGMPTCAGPIGWGTVNGMPNQNTNTTFLVCPNVFI